jgi:hypothetical protein
MKTMRNKLAKRRSIGSILLAGWALLMTLIALTNLTDLLYSFGWISWPFRSGNVDYLTKVTSAYVSDKALSQWLLGVIVVGQFVIVAMLWRSARSWKLNKPSSARNARAALGLLSAQWFVFAISTELFVSYRVLPDTKDFMLWLTATLATLLVVDLVSDPD